MTNQEKFDNYWKVKFRADYPSDCERIIGVAKSKLDIDMTMHQAEFIWRNYSDTFCAGWLIIASDAEIVDVLSRFI